MLFSDGWRDQRCQASIFQASVVARGDGRWPSSQSPASYALSGCQPDLIGIHLHAAMRLRCTYYLLVDAYVQHGSACLKPKAPRARPYASQQSAGYRSHGATGLDGCGTGICSGSPVMMLCGTEWLLPYSCIARICPLYLSCSSCVVEEGGGGGVWPQSLPCSFAVVDADGGG